MYRDVIVLLIFFSYCINFPIIKEWGYASYKPFALVFSDQTVAIEFCRLISQEPYLFFITDKKETVKEALTKGNSEAVCIFYRHCKGYQPKTITENLNQVISSSQFGQIEDKKSVAASFLVFLGFVPDDLRPQVLEVHLKESQVTESIESLMALIPNADELPIVNRMIKQFEQDDVLPLKAAAAFLYPRLEEKGEEAIYEEMINACSEIMKAAKEYCETDSLKNLIIGELQQYYISARPPVYKVSDIDILDIDCLENAFILDNDKLYLRETHFKKIIEKVIDTISVDALKDRLQREDVIIGKPGAYTQKIRVKIQGKFKTLRVITLNLDEMPELKSFLILM